MHVHNIKILQRLDRIDFVNSYFNLRPLCFYQFKTTIAFLSSDDILTLCINSYNNCLDASQRTEAALAYATACAYLQIQECASVDAYVFVCASMRVKNTGSSVLNSPCLPPSTQPPISRAGVSQSAWSKGLGQICEGPLKGHPQLHKLTRLFVLWHRHTPRLWGIRTHSPEHEHGTSMQNPQKTPRFSTLNQSNKKFSTSEGAEGLCLKYITNTDA